MKNKKEPKTSSRVECAHDAMVDTVDFLAIKW